MVSSEEGRKSVVHFLRSYYDIIVLVGVLFAVLWWSFGTLLTKPKLWIDESVSINISRSFMNAGVLSPQTAPDSFFGFPELIQSTGYPVTVLLSGFFQVFGYSVGNARLFMLFWLALALVLVFFLMRELSGKESACFSLLLVASFASFYGSGRTVVGEIPGFVFLLAGFWLLLVRGRYFWTGIFWGLAVVTKPSVFGLIIPAIILTFLFERRDFFRRTILLGVGMIPAALLWAVLVLPNPFSATTWAHIGAFYKNPYSSSISENIIRNLTGVFHTTTLMYFGLLLLVVLVARFFFTEVKIQTLYVFTLFYSVLAFFYYLRSPGWLRYILIAELLILTILPHALAVLATRVAERYKKVKISPNRLSSSMLGALVLVQVVQMFTIAKIFSSDEDLRVATYLAKNFPTASVGLLNAPNVDILLEPARSFLAVDLTGMPVVGENPLFRKSLPDVVVSYARNRFFDEGKKVLDERYIKDSVFGAYTVYARVQRE